jgi:hypothetical protein
MVSLNARLNCKTKAPGAKKEMMARKTKADAPEAEFIPAPANDHLVDLTAATRSRWVNCRG